MKNTIITILVGLLFIMLVGEYCRQAHTVSMTQKAPMSVRELQTFLNDQPDPWKRYVCKVDGIWGKETETALENYLCDKNAKECFE